MARIGELFVEGGRLHGRQIVDRTWIERALTPIVSIGAVDPYVDGYGYLWYTKRYRRPGGSVVIQFASGNGGNKISIVPALGLVVAITSSAFNTSYGQRRPERILLGVIDPLLEAG